MTTNYPGALDDDTVLKQSSGDDVTDSTVSSVNHPTAHNNLADAVIAVQTALGINPQGSFADVAARIANALTGAPAAAQTITATADVVPLAVKLGNGSWTSNLFEIRNASNTIIAFISKAGLINCQSLNIGGSPIASTNLSDSAQLARLASPTFTGTPSAPTASPGTNTTQIATTAFVTAASFAPLNSPAFTGTPTAPTASPGTNTTQIATTAFVLANSPPSGGTHIPIDLRNPQQTTNIGNAYPTILAFTAWEVSAWDLVANLTGVVYGIFRIPESAQINLQRIILEIMCSATSGVTRMYVESKNVGSTSSMNPGSLTLSTAQDVTVPGTAWTRKSLSFTVPTDTWAAGDMVIVKVTHDGAHANDTLAVDTILTGAWAQIVS